MYRHVIFYRYFLCSSPPAILWPFPSILSSLSPIPLPHSSARPVSQTSSIPLSFMPTLDNSISSLLIVFTYLFLVCNIYCEAVLKFFIYSLRMPHVYSMLWWYFDIHPQHSSPTSSRHLSLPLPPPQLHIFFSFSFYQPRSPELVVPEFPWHEPSSESWSIYPGLRPWKKHWFFFPRKPDILNNSSSMVAGWRVETPKAFRHPCWDADWLDFLQSTTVSKFKGAIALKYPENTIVQHSFLISGSYSLIVSSSAMFPEPWR